MTEKYAAYLVLLATRDQALTSLAALAFCVVIAWELAPLWPLAWRPLLRKVYLIGGLVLYFATLMIVALIGVNGNG